MALHNYGVDQGLRIFDPNTDVSVDIIKINGVPGGDAGIEDAAAIGSVALREDTGDFYVKIALVGAPSDWKRLSSDEATDMFLTSAYDNTTNGDAADGDSVSVALGKIDANQRDLTTLSGNPQGALDHGDFSGSTIQSNRNTRQALQDLETALEGISGGGQFQSLGVTTAVRLGAFLVDDSIAGEYEIVIEDAADEANRVSLKINALHNGTPSADATTVDTSRFARNKVGSSFNYTVGVSLSGVGAAQDVALDVASTEPSGVNVYARRTLKP